jgi:NADPH2:quinone reductase
VTATVRREELRGEVKALGATAIDPEGFADHGPFDVVLELVGAPNFPDNLRALGMRGRVVVIGVGAGARTELNLHAIMGKRARVMGATLRPRPLEQKAEAMRLVEHEVLPLFESGDLRVPVAATYPLDDVEAAYARFEEGGKLGKLVLLP